MGSRGEAIPMTHEIMGHPQVFERVASLALMGKTSFQILHNLKNQLLNDDFKEAHISRFLTQFWSTERRCGFGAQHRKHLTRFLQSDPDLTQDFQEILENVLANKDPKYLHARYGVGLTSEQAKNLYTQNTYNHLLHESQLSTQAEKAKESETRGRLMNQLAKYREDIIDSLEIDDEHKGRSDRNNGCLFD